MATKVVRRKPGGLLKKFLDTDKAGSRFVGPVDKHLMTRPLDSDRRTDVLHPSELCSEDWCHRASYFLLSGVKPNGEPKRNSAHLERIFEEGHLIHNKWQTWASEMGNLYGVWACRSCDEKWWARGHGRYIACPRCNAVQAEYAEVPCQSPKHRISGQADGWILDQGDPFLIEIKSVGIGTVRFEAPHLLTKHDSDMNEIWKDITRPFKKHRLQGQLYLALLELMEDNGKLVLPEGYERPQEIVFVYEFKANQQRKEFVVQQDPEAVADILHDASEIVYAVKKKTPLDCNLGGCEKCEPFDAEGPE